MNYTWGYIKNATLVKLDMPITGTIMQGLVNKFPFYANEAMTYICSSIKPKWKYAYYKVRDRKKVIVELICKYDKPVTNDAGITTWPLREDGLQTGKVDLSFLDATWCQEEDLNDTQKKFKAEYDSYTFLYNPVQFPDDFVSPGDDAPIVIRHREIRVEDMHKELLWECHHKYKERIEAHDEDFNYRGSNELIFFEEGYYAIAYNARWFTFASSTSDEVIIDAPADIIDALPSYIASQCLKIDDEQKAAIMRNEYEMMIARIDNTHYVQNKTIKIGGDW